MHGCKFDQMERMEVIEWWEIIKIYGLHKHSNLQMKINILAMIVVVALSALIISKNFLFHLFSPFIKMQIIFIKF